MGLLATPAWLRLEGQVVQASHQNACCDVGIQTVLKIYLQVKLPTLTLHTWVTHLLAIIDPEEELPTFLDHLNLANVAPHVSPLVLVEVPLVEKLAGARDGHRHFGATRLQITASNFVLDLHYPPP